MKYETVFLFTKKKKKKRRIPESNVEAVKTRAFDKLIIRLWLSQIEYQSLIEASRREGVVRGFIVFSSTTEAVGTIY